MEARLQRALDVVRWLHAVSGLSDGCCRLVCDVLDVPTLVRLMEVSQADDEPYWRNQPRLLCGFCSSRVMTVSASVPPRKNERPHAGFEVFL